LRWLPDLWNGLNGWSGLVENIPVLKSYLGFFIAAPFFLVSLALYLLILFLTLVGSVIAVWFGVEIVRLLPGIILAVLLALVLAVGRLGWFSARLAPLDALRHNKNFRLKYGAKAVNLSRLLHDGENVPPGFALRAPRRPLADKEIRRLAIIVSQRLAGKKIVVRSSFPQEDSDDASFAGIFTSLTGIDADDVEAVAAATKKVLCSYREPAYAFYRRRYQPDLDGEGMSVIFQEQIREILAGVAFSVDVTNGRTECRMIELERGGRATWLTSKVDEYRRLLLGDAAALGPELLGRINATIDRVADRLNRPTEIEWGWDGRRLWLYQARPITALAPLVTWFVQPGVTPMRALTPLSATVVDLPEMTAGVLGRLGLLATHRLLKEFGGVRYASWSEVETARRRLRTGRFPRRAYVALWRLLAGPLEDRREGTPANATLPQLADLLRREIIAQQNDRFRAETYGQWVAALTGRRLVAADLDRRFPLGEDNPWRKIAGEIERQEDGLLEKYGWLTREESELAAPRAADDPEILRDFSRLPQPDLPAEKDDWITLLAPLQIHVAWRWLPGMADRLARRRRQALLRVEERHLQILRLLAAVAGAARAQAAALNLAEEDVFFCTFPELLAGRSPTRSELARRKTAYQAARQGHVMPIFHERDDRAVTFTLPNLTPNSLFGVGLGGGTVDGRLVSADEQDEPPATDAIILIPDTGSAHIGKLAFARPLVAASGGALSHLGIIARETGIPLFIANGEHALRPGMRVSIDFTRGVLRHD